MAFTQLPGEFSHVHALPDQPRLADGYTPSSVKDAFDLAGKEIQSYLNETHLAELSSTAGGLSGAERIGSAAAGGIAAGSIHDQITALKAICDSYDSDLTDAVNGIIPPATIAFTALDTDTQAKINAGFTRGNKIAAYTVPGSYTFTVPKTGTYRLRICGGGNGGSFFHNIFMNMSSAVAGMYYECRGGVSGSAIETWLDLTAGAEIPLTVGAGAAAPIGSLDPTLSSTNEYNDIVSYISSSGWASTGGSSSFGDTQGAFSFTCPGGSFTADLSAVCTGTQSYPLLQHAGIYPPALMDNVLSFAADGSPSALGNGGLTTGSLSVPGIGGGGYGGKLRLLNGTFHVHRAPIAGGDGAVLLEYIN